MMFNPLEQFAIIPALEGNSYLLKLLLNNEVTRFIINIIAPFLSNLTTLCVGILSLITIFVIYSKKNSKVKKTHMYIILEYVYKLLLNMIVSNAGSTSFILPLIGGLFFSLLIFNFYGILPFSYTATSHIISTLFFSFMFFFGFNYLSYKQFQFEVFNKFIPQNTPLIILPALFIIEIVSYLSRLFSLAIRLFANMMSGHTLIHILVSFLYQAFQSMKGSILTVSIIPVIIIHIIIVMETAIAGLQVYVFVVLLTLYLGDSFYLNNH